MEKTKQASEALWAQIKEDLRTRGQADGYAIDFISELSLIEDTGTKLKFEYPEGYMVEWLEMSYSHYIADAAAHVLNAARELEFVEASSSVEIEVEEAPCPEPEQKKPSAPAPAARRSATRLSRVARQQTYLNEEYTFENYVVGASNHFAYAAAQALVNADERVFNPLFIYGNSGMGKTHLLHAIGNALRARKPDVPDQNGQSDPGRFCRDASRQLLPERARADTRYRRYDEVSRNHERHEAEPCLRQAQPDAS